MRRALQAGVACAMCALLLAASVAAEFVPNSSDAPYVPTPQPLVEAMLKIANVGPGDTVMDLGSGDGRIPITAARQFGARGIGIEYSFHLLIQSEEAARQAGVEKRVTFLQEDLFKADLSPATVITLFLYPKMNERLLPRLLALRPGTRIVVNRFAFADWKPDRQGELGDRYFLHIVPARVAGTWSVRVTEPQGEREITLDVQQRFQELRVTARAGAETLTVEEARIEGERITVALRGAGANWRLAGRVQGAEMVGEAGGWRASRQTAAPKP